MQEIKRPASIPADGQEVAAMHTTDAKEITNAEAEAALRALGGPLVWHVNANFARVKGGMYLVARYQRRRFLWRPAYQFYKAARCQFYKLGGGQGIGEKCDVYRKKHPTLDTAKAACERHHVTGRWE